MIPLASLLSPSVPPGRGASRQPAGGGAFALPGDGAAEDGPTLLPDDGERHDAADGGNALPIEAVIADPWPSIVPLQLPPVVRAPDAPMPATGSDAGQIKAAQHTTAVTSLGSEPAIGVGRSSPANPRDSRAAKLASVAAEPDIFVADDPIEVANGATVLPAPVPNGASAPLAHTDAGGPGLSTGTIASPVTAVERRAIGRDTPDLVTPGGISRPSRSRINQPTDPSPPRFLKSAADERGSATSVEPTRPTPMQASSADAPPFPTIAAEIDQVDVPPAAAHQRRALATSALTPVVATEIASVAALVGREASTGTVERPVANTIEGMDVGPVTTDVMASRSLRRSMEDVAMSTSAPRSDPAPALGPSTGQAARSPFSQHPSLLDASNVAAPPAPTLPDRAPVIPTVRTVESASPPSAVTAVPPKPQGKPAVVNVAPTVTTPSGVAAEGARGRSPAHSVPTLPVVPLAPGSPIVAAPPPVAASAIVFGAARFAASRLDRNDEPAAPVGQGGVGGVMAAPPTQLGAAVQATASAPLDIRHERWPHAMVERIEMIRDAVADAADVADTRIRLVPDALGSIDVAVRQDGDTLHVRFTAEQPQTRALLQDAAPRLADAAEARGLRLGQTSVGSDAAGQHPSQQRQPAPSAAPRAPVSPSVAADPADTDDTRLA